MNEIRLTTEAKQDLVEIKLYISKKLRNPIAARRVVDKIIRDLDILESYALAGPSLQELNGIKTDLRILVCGNYIAAYRVEERLILVSRIINARLDYMRILFGDGDDITLY